jgi:hypothetical protein
LSVFAVLRKVWNDSVWSKVIAAGITAALAAIGSLAFAHGGTLGDLAAVLTQPVPVPLWLLLALGLAFVGALMFRRLGNAGADDEAQPNAVPIARIDTLILERPFESLSSRQQHFLARQFRLGMRGFRAAPELKDAAWFEELVKWHYIALQETDPSDSSRCEITPAGWQELERVRSEAGLPAR